MFVAVLSVLGVGFYAYKLRQKTLRRQEQVKVARVARTQANVMFAEKDLPAVDTPKSVGL